MIYIDYQRIIHPCILCESHKKARCDCVSVIVYHYANLVEFQNIFNLQSPIEQRYYKDSALENYQEDKKYLIPKLKVQCPLAKKFLFFPYNPIQWQRA